MTKQNLDENREQLLAEERLIFLTQAVIQRELNRRGLKYRDLARQLGVSVARISQLMGDDPHNLTVRTVARILHQLGEAGVFITKRELAELKGDKKGIETATWVFTAPTRHFYGGGEDSEVIFEVGPFKEASDDGREWIEAEVAAAGRRI